MKNKEKITSITLYYPNGEDWIGAGGMDNMQLVLLHLAENFRNCKLIMATERKNLFIIEIKENDLTVYIEKIISSP